MSLHFANNIPQHLHVQLLHQGIPLIIALISFTPYFLILLYIQEPEGPAPGPESEVKPSPSAEMVPLTTMFLPSTVIALPFSIPPMVSVYIVKTFLVMK